MNRLTKRISENIIELSAKANPIQYNGSPQRVHIKHQFWNVFNKLCEYEDAEEQGLLLRLPCKIGDTVYTACSWGIESGVVGSIEIIADRIFVNNPYGAMIGEANNIFLTKEEAEQALARMEKSHE